MPENEIEIARCLDRSRPGGGISHARVARLEPGVERLDHDHQNRQLAAHAIHLSSDIISSLLGSLSEDELKALLRDIFQD